MHYLSFSRLNRVRKQCELVAKKPLELSRCNPVTGVPSTRKRWSATVQQHATGRTKYGTELFNIVFMRVCRSALATRHVLVTTKGGVVSLFYIFLQFFF